MTRKIINPTRKKLSRHNRVKKRARRSNGQFRGKFERVCVIVAGAFLVAPILGSLSNYRTQVSANHEFISPQPDTAVGVISSETFGQLDLSNSRVLVKEDKHQDLAPTPTARPTATPTPDNLPANNMQQIDVWVGKYVDLYFDGSRWDRYQRSEARHITHCILQYESHHNQHDGAQGDGGKANGPLQYHLPSWARMRNWMINENEAEVIGSPNETETAIQTFVFVLHRSRLPKAERRGSIAEWGPIYRTLKGNYNMTNCPVPSWTHSDILKRFEKGGEAGE